MVAKVKLKTGETKTCSFQRKEDKKIKVLDISRIAKFICDYTSQGYRVSLKWRVVYNKKRGMITGISSGEDFIKERTNPARFERLVNILNNYLHE